MNLNRKSFQKGDVLTVDFPYNDQNAFKRRPAVVTRVSGDNIVIAKITSQIKNHPNNVLLTDYKAAGLFKESQVQCNRQVSLNRYSPRIIKKVGHLADYDLTLVEKRQPIYKMKNIKIQYKNIVIINTLKIMMRLYIKKIKIIPDKRSC